MFTGALFWLDFQNCVGRKMFVNWVREVLTIPWVLGVHHGAARIDAFEIRGNRMTSLLLRLIRQEGNRKPQRPTSSLLCASCFH